MVSSEDTKLGYNTSDDQIVSFDDESLIVVDKDDNVLGFEAKNTCHTGEGILHRAFSVFIFDPDGRVLIQQRASGKPLWPLYWANACCSHPRRGERDAEAADRRVREELGIGPPLQFLYKFQYHARFGDHGSEHELCSIYAAVTEADISVNTTEITDTQWMPADELDADIVANPNRYAPWFKLEWPRIRQEHWPTITALLPGTFS